MGPLGELLATDHRQTLEFFATRLSDVCGPDADRRELLYSASVLAHYSQTSTVYATGLSAPANLSVVFDHFVANSSMLNDALMMEAAGAQCLLLAGFFEAQMCRRHNIRWYSGLGSGFFARAASLEDSTERSRTFDRMARRFESWRARCAQLGREMRDEPYLLPPPQPPHLM